MGEESLITDIRRLQTQWADLSLKLQEARTDIRYLKKNTSEHRSILTDHQNLLHELETKELRKAAFFTLLGQHWWKAMLVLAPIMGVLIEIAIYLRHLPAPK